MGSSANSNRVPQIIRLMEKLKSSPYSVSDFFCGSLNCINSLLTLEQKNHIKSHQDIEKFCNSFSTGKIIESLISHSMGLRLSPQHVHQYETLKQISYNIINSNKISRWRFIVDGPQHSGKSTYLSLIAKSAVQFLGSNNLLSNY